jgi:chemotaxis protein CheX
LDDVLKLPATLDVARARVVFDDLTRRRGVPLTIDASQVEKVSALAIEGLIAAGRQWRADGLNVTVTDMSRAFVETLEDLGLNPIEDLAAPASTAGDGGAR